jgi:hypothetical protein
LLPTVSVADLLLDLASIVVVPDEIVAKSGLAGCHSTGDGEAGPDCLEGGF